jgi:beta-carotene 3-hydroxylase
VAPPDLTLPRVLAPQGLGITLFGMAYMFVHDGLVHRRFPVGPIENVPYFRRVAAAHQVWIPSCSPHLSPSYY